MTGPVVGVDGGATRSRAVILDGDGREVARTEGGPAVADARSPDRAAAGVAELVRATATAAGVELPLPAVWAGLAGAGREDSRSAVQAALRGTAVAAHVRVGTDVEAAFHHAFPSGPGILLVAGTGSMAHGRSEGGREARTGGWGPLLGDEGSGYSIALEALRSVVRARDGRGPETALTALLLGELGLAAEEALVSWSAEASKGQVAALAPTVIRAALGGDPVALDIEARAVEALRQHVLALVDLLGPWATSPAVGLTGGLLNPGGPLRDALARALAGDPVVLFNGAVDAALGAAYLARSLVNEPSA
jgi:glucosamine kinase